MSMSYWRGARHGSRWLLCAMLILIPVTLAACGSIAAPVFSATPNSAGPAAADIAAPADRALCADPASASRVVISRFSHLRQIPEGSLPPAQVAVITGVRVRVLARALCALPRMGKGVFACPAQFEGTFALRFTADGRRLPVVTAQESGCEIVKGLGPARTASRSREFWTVLASTLSIASPVRPLLFPDNPPRKYCASVPVGTGQNMVCPGSATPGRSSRK